jgi:hypothetical protein
LHSGYLQINAFGFASKFPFTTIATLSEFGGCAHNKNPNKQPAGSNAALAAAGCPDLM